MNALVNPLAKHEGIESTPGPSVWVIIRDETGPLNSYVTGGELRKLPPEVLLQLVRAAHPSLNVLSVEWPTEEQRKELGTFGSTALIVRIPGTHEIPAPKQREPKKPRKSAVDVSDAWDPTEDDQVQRRDYWKYRGKSVVAEAPARVPTAPSTSTEVVNTCSCGTPYTAAEFAALPFVGAKDVRENGLVHHEDYRNCTKCGSTRMVMTTRIAGGQR